MGKKKIEVQWEGKTYSVGWFSGSEGAAIEKAIISALQLDSNTVLQLVDEQNDVIAISDAIPDGLKLICLNKSARPILEPKGPKPLPLIGNTLDLSNKDGSVAALKKLVDTYGSMVPLQVPGLRFFVCSDADVLQDTLKRQDDFQKIIPPSNMDLGNIRAFTAGDGLFTSSDSEEIWQIAHRILLPAFGLESIKHYYSRIMEVADELIKHFDSFGKRTPLLVTDWMTRMTFEAIGYASSSTRFRCMDQKELPPFVEAMMISLADAMHASQRFLPDSFYFISKQKRQQADALMRETVDAIIDKRKKQMMSGASVPNDILQIMLTGKDRVTGKMLPEDNIRNQLITFLIAGHETTSGLLSYAIYRLITNPKIEEKLIQEVDQVLGRDYDYKPTFSDLEKLQYTQRVLKESLRLDPTAPGFSKTAMCDTVVAGKYQLRKGDMILFLLPSLHRNPKYWSGDPDSFDPDRFLPEQVNARHPDAYHPFGAGIRSCIGFQFAFTEATMLIARLYQRYHFRLYDRNYTLQHVESLTIKPKDLYVLIEKRKEEKGRGPVKQLETQENYLISDIDESAPALLFLYGSNMGTCQGVAQQLAQRAQAKGYRPIVKELDAQADQSWESSYAIIVTSTYNGTPPDNASHFEKWIKSAKGNSLNALSYCVLGLGNKQWHATFQQFPRFIDKRMQELGAQRFASLGAADLDGDYDQTIEEWTKIAWETLKSIYPPKETKVPEEEISDLLYSCEITNFAGAQSNRVPTTILDQQAMEMVLERNEELLTEEAQRSTRHIEIRLPKQIDYRAGDHLGVLPQNAPEIVELAAQLLNLRLDDLAILRSRQDTPQAEKLPLGIPISVKDLLTSYVDLQGPVSRKELRLLAKHTPCPPERKMLEALASSEFAHEVLEKELTFLELCQKYRSIECSLELLLSVRPILKPRYYSISSSPLILPESISITVGVQQHVTATGRVHKGLCSNYLAKIEANGKLQCFVKDTKSAFRLPDDSSKDIILIGPGTGVAPLRGFLQERDQQKKRGILVGRQILFFGCRHPNQDYIYRNELEGFLESGLLEGLFVAFSRFSNSPKYYVQDLLLQQSSLIWEYIQKQARILVCGDGKQMAPSVRETMIRIIENEAKLSNEDAAKYFKQLQAEKLYVEDVWA